MPLNDYDNWFMALAAEVAKKSKDPSTKCGAVVARGKRLISVGFNGFPQHVHDHPERYADRELKLKMVVHAEVNAVLFAQRDLYGCTIYVYPMPPCSRCAGVIIQAGISRIVSIIPSDRQRERWGDDLRVSDMMFTEADILQEYVNCN